MDQYQISKAALLREWVATHLSKPYTWRPQTWSLSSRCGWADDMLFFLHQFDGIRIDWDNHFVFTTPMSFVNILKYRTHPAPKLRWRDEVGTSLRTRHQGINKSRGSKQPRFRTSKIIPKNLIDNLQSPIDTSTSVIMFTQSLRASVCPILSFWPYPANNYSAPRSPVSRDSKPPAW